MTTKSGSYTAGNTQYTLRINGTASGVAVVGEPSALEEALIDNYGEIIDNVSFSGGSWSFDDSSDAISDTITFTALSKYYPFYDLQYVWTGKSLRLKDDGVTFATLENPVGRTDIESAIESHYGDTSLVKSVALKITVDISNYYSSDPEDITATNAAYTLTTHAAGVSPLFPGYALTAFMEGGETLVVKDHTGSSIASYASIPATSALEYAVDSHYESGGDYIVTSVDSVRVFTARPIALTSEEIDIPGDPPVAVDSSVTVTQDVDFEFSSSDFDFTDTEEDELDSIKIANLAIPSGDSLVVDQGSGDVAVTNGMTITAAQIPSLTYIPESGMFGNNRGSFDFFVNDHESDGVVSATMTVHISEHINVVPVATDSSITARRNGSYAFALSDFGYTDSEDDDIESITISAVSLNLGDTLKAFGSNVVPDATVAAASIDRLVYTPAAGQYGDARSSFEFKVNDSGEGTVAATMTLNVATNTPPVATDKTVSTFEDTPLNFIAGYFTFTDGQSDSMVSVTLDNLNLAAGDTLQLDGVDVEEDQTILLADIPGLTYTPAANANGAGRSTFDFKVNDSESGTVAATMTINVGSVNDPPTLTTTASDPTFFQDDSGKSLFSGTAISAIDSSQTIESITIEVEGLEDGDDEILIIDGADYALENGTTIDGGLTVTISGSGATVELSGSFSESDAQDLIDSLAYRNDAEPLTNGERGFVIVEIVDSGSDNNTATLEVGSYVTCVSAASPPVINPGGNYALDPIMFCGSLQTVNRKRPVFRESQSDWDEMTQIVEVAGYQNKQSALTVAGARMDQKHPDFPYFYVVDVSGSERKDILGWEFSLVYRGVFNLRKFHRSITSQKEQFQFEGTTDSSTPNEEGGGSSGGSDSPITKYQAQIPRVTLVDTTFLAHQPDFEDQGNVVSPRNAPSPPGIPSWNFDDTIVYVPNGWVLESRAVEYSGTLDAGVFKQVDTISYYERSRPSG